MSTADPYYADIRKVVMDNKQFHRELYSVGTMSLVVMNIPVGGEIGSEAHAEKSQYTEIIDGTAEAIVDGKSYAMSSGHVMIFPPGVTHNVRNVHPEKNLKLYSIYSYNVGKTLPDHLWSKLPMSMIDDTIDIIIWLNETYPATVVKAWSKEEMKRIVRAVRFYIFDNFDRIDEDATTLLHKLERQEKSQLREAIHEATMSAEELNKKFQMTTQNDNFSIFYRWIQDPRITSVTKNNALRWAAQYGHSFAVDILLQDPLVDPAANHSFALNVAAVNGHLDIVKRLLQDPRVDPTAYNNISLIAAIRHGHSDVVKALLKDGRADPTARNYEAVRTAEANYYYKVIDLLLEDPRVDASKIETMLNQDICNLCHSIIENPLSAEQIKERMDKVEAEVAQYVNKDATNLTNDALRKVYLAFDKYFLHGCLEKHFTSSPDSLSFEVSEILDNNVAGRCSTRSHLKRCKYTIIINNQTFSVLKFDNSWYVTGGKKCYSARECFLEVFAHELVHLMMNIKCSEQTLDDEYQNHGRIFRAIAYSLFGQIDFAHGLSPGREYTRQISLSEAWQEQSRR